MVGHWAGGRRSGPPRARDPRPPGPPARGGDDLPLRRGPRGRDRGRLALAHAAGPDAAARLVAAGDVEVTQGGSVVDVATARGPVRIRRVR